MKLSVMHWPVAFIPRDDPTAVHGRKAGFINIDLETSIVDTWQAMIALPKTKVCHASMRSY